MTLTTMLAISMPIISLTFRGRKQLGRLTAAGSAIVASAPIVIALAVTRNALPRVVPFTAPIPLALPVAVSPDDDMPGDPHDGSDVYDPPQTLDLDDDGVLPRGDDAPRGLHYVVHLVRGAYAPGLRMGHVDALQMVGDPRTFVRQTVPPRAD